MKPLPALFALAVLGLLAYASRRRVVRFTPALVLLVVSSAACGQDIFITQQNAGKVSEYKTDGSLVNASLISGLSGPTSITLAGSDLFIKTSTGISVYTTSGALLSVLPITGESSPTALVVSGTDLFLENMFAGTVGEYSTNGATINSAILSGFNTPDNLGGIAVSGTNLFVASTKVVNRQSSGVIGEYTFSGGVVNASLISGFNIPTSSDCLCLSGTDLFVATGEYGVVGEYTTSGQVVNSSLLTCGFEPYFITASGSDLFVGDGLSPSGVSEYTTSGVMVNSSLITGLSYPSGIAVSEAPEPSTFVLLAVAAAIGVVWKWTSRKVPI